jgi:hypothetical protein
MEGKEKVGMIEYSVMLKRFPGSSRSDVCIFRDENRDVALCEMHRYVKHNGFSIHERDGHFTIADVVLIEKEPIVGSPVISETSYCKLFND